MLKIKRLNCNGEELDCVIDETKIDGLSERVIPNEPLYDCEGNQVDEKVRENVYDIYFSNGRQIIVPKATYDKLVKKLSIETL